MASIDADFELTFEDGVCHAVRPDLALTVVGEGGQVFHRRAIKKHADGTEERASMLVARLGDVSVYYTEGGIIVSKEDLYL